ncbi:MAG: hypothetical protein P3W87_007085 [Gammaproteobacteria bacterium]|nr:hypothetical protein [Gammaproteobacteria bacterium]
MATKEDEILPRAELTRLDAACYGRYLLDTEGFEVLKKALIGKLGQLC